MNNGVAKLGDMNVSKIAKKGLLYTQTGTPYYARYATELLII
jgi:NIMA (never in mitosis gene a)-related kinase